MLNSFDITGDFWLLNPLIGLIPPFNELKDEPDSSPIMWAICMIEDPNTYNKLFVFKKAERLNWVCKNYLNVEESEFVKNYEKYLNGYKYAVLTSKEELEYYEWSKKLEERDMFMHNTPYNEDTFEMLDKMIGNHDKIWKLFREAGKALFSKSELERTRGNIIESESSQGLI